MKDQSCPRCGGETVKKSTTAQHTIGGKTGHTSIDYFQCKKCGEQYFDVEALQRLFGEGKDDAVKH